MDQQQQHSSSAVDEAYINGLYLGLSFNSLLTSNSSPNNNQTLNLLKTPKSDTSSSSSQNIITAVDHDRRKRQRSRLGDKVRGLQKMLPVNRKMDMASVLEETYKYVRYLQAQVSVLRCMPEKSTIGVGVGELNRQEVLRVMVNSAVAQDKMYSSGCCVYSLEQLVVLKDVAEKKQALFNHHNQMMMMMFGSNADAANPHSFY